MKKENLLVRSDHNGTFPNGDAGIGMDVPSHRQAAQLVEEPRTALNPVSASRFLVLGHADRPGAVREDARAKEEQEEAASQFLSETAKAPCTIALHSRRFDFARMPNHYPRLPICLYIKKQSFRVNRRR